MHPWRLDQISYQGVRSQENGFEVAVLPLGATEPHNFHLPYGTDTFQVEVIGNAACEYAQRQGVQVLLLPTLPYGTETNLKQFPFAMNVRPSTIARIITDLIESLEQAGVRKCVLLNGHGGNDLKWILRELYGSTPVHLFVCNWYKVAADQHAALFQEPGDHAGELETSMGLAHFPELVSMAQLDARPVRDSRFAAVRQGWVELTRPWHLLTPHSGVGDPSAATAEKGQKLTQLVSERIGSFLVELARSPLDAYFPFQ